MTISEQGGIADSMSVEFTPGPVLHEPAMTILELRTIIAMPTSDWVRNGCDVEKIRRSSEHLTVRGTPTITSDVVVYNVQRRFTLARYDAIGLWGVEDTHTDKLVATFASEAHAVHYANRLEADPSLADA